MATVPLPMSSTLPGEGEGRLRNWQYMAASRQGALGVVQNTFVADEGEKSDGNHVDAAIHSVENGEAMHVPVDQADRTATHQMYSDPVLYVVMH